MFHASQLKVVGDRSVEKELAKDLKTYKWMDHLFGLFVFWIGGRYNKGRKGCNKC